MTYNDTRVADIEWSADSILDFLKQNRDVLRSMGVNKIGLFGSFARGEQGPNSDVDVLVNLKRETFRDYMGLLNFLEGIFGRKVDLVMKDTIKPIIRNRILRETVYVEGF